MKKVIRTAAMIALMFVTTASIANDEKLSLESTKESKSLVFEMDSQKETTIKFLDADNQIMFSENISAVSYSKKFNLKNVADGLYYFTTEDALRKITYTISVINSDVEIISEKESVKPVFKTKDGIIYLNLLNLTKKDVKIEVYDSKNRIVFSEKRENELTIQKAFNFTNAFEDRYTVLVKDSDNTYYENIVVN